MDKMISKGVEADEFNRNLLYSYTDAISKARSSFKDEKLDFQRGLLASIVAILFLSLAGIIHLSGNIPIGLEIPMLFVIPILVITIRDNAL